MTITFYTMIFCNLRFALASIAACLFFSFTVNAQPSGQHQSVYDGYIDSDKIILVKESKDPVFMKGYFVVNRGKTIEDVHPFSIDFSGRKPFFQSDLFTGPLKQATTDTTQMSGTLKLMNKKKRFLFFRTKAVFDLTLRHAENINPTEKYKEEVFNDIEVKSDILYGKALGYWTHSPYSDDPYVVTLGKGLIKSFKDLQPLDLKLDLYYSKTDLFKNRPCVLLIHGGAFYIGSKESVCEQALATSLAKRGYFVASIDYRLGFKPTPADIEMSAYRAIQDAHAALRFLAHHSPGLGINPNQIYVGGTSAGGVASLNVAFMDNDERPARILENEKKGTVSKIEESGNKFTETFTIKAVANMWGAVSDLNLIDRDEKIPVLSIHGTHDDVVPFEYDFPFRNSLMINRMIMDKMYGSKSIHDRLNSVGIRNRLVALPGMGHEPELETYNKLNTYIDTLTSNISAFFYEETAPAILLPASQLSVNPNASLKSIYYEVSNGKAIEVMAEGGVKANSNPADATVIWFSKAESRKLKIISTNQFEAWSINEFPVTIVQSDIIVKSR
ncbi:MAG: alpha/beta hydrolase [Draconibacterium sp.]|nr:alpha/beta hydrolase [Draconibacterium sp.]